MTLPASLEGRDRARLFLALVLPDATVERLVPWQQRELAGGRIVDPANLHVTLAFLGGTPVERLGDVVEALREAAGRAVAPVLTVTGYRETRSVGMLVLDDLEQRATRLAEDLHGRLEALGVYERENRRWLPHLTVVRFGRGDRGRHPLTRSVLPDLGEVAPSEAAVYLSVLGPSGAQHEILESAALGGG